MNKATNAFDLIHYDIWDSFPMSPSCGSRYFLTIVVECSRALWIYLMIRKYEVGQLIQDFCAMINTQFNRSVNILRSDNGQEFLC